MKSLVFTLVLVENLIGCSSFIRNFESREQKAMRILGAKSFGEINNYYCGYVAHKKNKRDTDEAFICNASKYLTYPKIVCETMKEIDGKNGDKIITNKEVKEYVLKCQKHFK